MGWYHAVQVLAGRVPNAKLTHVVEPWYMSQAASGTPGHDAFLQFKNKYSAEIGFYQSVAEVPATSDDSEIRLSIISARTADNPKLFAACLQDNMKCKAIFLEKPGAPTVSELETMRDRAQEKGVKVFMGFNKNVSSYLVKSRAFVASSDKQCDITFLHNNNYKPEELPECFERNAEGMLKNMAIHELALLVTYYGVTVDTIAEVIADKEYSSCQTLKGPTTQKDFTDFDKLKFKIVTKSGASAYVAADRCGGDDSVAIVTSAPSSEELARFTMPDDETIANVSNLAAAHGDAMPYFYAQDPDYLKLKQLVVANLADGSPAEGVATIDVAVETLKVAEYLTPILQEQLK